MNSVWSHNKKEIDESKFHVQLAAIRGHEDYSITNMYKDDFYTLLIKASEVNKGIRKVFDAKAGATNMPTFEFDTEQELNNFMGYLKTDFSRFCLALYKNSNSLHRGELDIVPWLDFTQTWDDGKLYKHFGIDEETQEYIREFLPDYHGIRRG